MTNGSRVITTALRYEGLVEDPLGSNLGSQIERWQREAEKVYGQLAGTYRAAPWCAIWAGAMFREAGVEVDPDLVHPWTGTICATADGEGGLRPTRTLVPPGSLLVRCAVHVGIVVHDRGLLLDTIEGNASHGVRRLVRAKADWRIVVPPAIAGESASPLPAYRDSYGFDDLRLRPDLYGGWLSATARDEVMRHFAGNHPERWVAPVRVDRPSPFAFRTGPTGTYGATWRFGGWATQDIRDEQMRRYCRRVGHENVRIWRKRVPGPTNGAPESGAVTTT